MKASLLIMVLPLVFVSQGCGALDYLRKGPQKDALELEIKNANLQKQVEVLKGENQKIREQAERVLTTAKDENKALRAEVEHLQREVQRARDENKVLVERMAERQVQKPPQPVASKPEKPSKPLKIKVLSGDGDIASAKRMASRLEKMGLKVAAVDRAPRSDFSNDVIYFIPKIKKRAEAIASRVGGNKILKPLTWPSAYDLIIVTGKNP